MKKVQKSVLCLFVCICLLSTNLSVAAQVKNTTSTQSTKNTSLKSPNLNEPTPMYEEVEDEDQNHTLSMKDLTFIDEGQFCPTVFFKEFVIHRVGRSYIIS